MDNNKGKIQEFSRKIPTEVNTSQRNKTKMPRFGENNIKLDN